MRQTTRDPSARWLVVALLLAVVLPSPSRAQAMTPGPADRIGHWDPPFQETSPTSCPEAAPGCTPVPQAMAVLKDGRVYYFQGTEADEPAPGGTDPMAAARILDLRSGAPQWSVPKGAGPGRNGNLPEALACADMAQLGDGRIVSGPAPLGSRGAPILDPERDLMAQTGPMRHPRWYPSLVTGADGSILAVGGGAGLAGARTDGARRTETLDPQAARWTENDTSPASEASLPRQPRVFLTPNGKVFSVGAGEAALDTTHARDAALQGLQQFFDPETGKWELAGPVPWGVRDGATSVMLPLDPPYDRARILTFGGTTAAAGGAGLPLTTLTTVGRDGSVRNEITAPTQYARWLSSGVALPDGTVLALGGGNTAGPPGAEAPLREPEIFVPGVPSRSGAHAPGQWFRMATPSRDRTYHGSAVLLADGRVLVGGHRPRPVNGTAQGVHGSEADPSFEIYSPHYLYRGARPVIRQVPAQIGWGATFPIATGQALAIQSVVLMRLPSPQHVSDSDARTLRLRFTRKHGGMLSVVAPPDGAVAPPGYYYLFINKETPKGPVPSVARIVRLG